MKDQRGKENCEIKMQKKEREGERWHQNQLVINLCKAVYRLRDTNKETKIVGLLVRVTRN